jgi:hypothetical protein
LLILDAPGAGLKLPPHLIPARGKVILQEGVSPCQFSIPLSLKFISFSVGESLCFIHQLGGLRIYIPSGKTGVV